MFYHSPIRELERNSLVIMEERGPQMHKQRCLCVAVIMNGLTNFITNIFGGAEEDEKTSVSPTFDSMDCPYCSWLKYG